MSFSERLTNKSERRKDLNQQFVDLRQTVHQSMRIEEELRLKENPTPTEQELYMGAFKEWLEPQVRDAIEKMFRKGYATQSSGFHGEKCDLQTVDGNFQIDDKTGAVLKQMGVDVLRGTDIGIPKNKFVTMLRFRAEQPSLRKMKGQWDAIAAVLPANPLPPGIRPICDPAEEFRNQYAPEHPSLEKEREAFIEYLRRNAG